VAFEGHHGAAAELTADPCESLHQWTNEPRKNAMGTPDETSPGIESNSAATLFRKLKPKGVAQISFRGTQGDLARAWLWSKHTVRGAIGAGAIVVAVIVAVGWLISALPWPPKPSLEWAFGLGTTLAAVLGGLFGVLQTILVFAVQLRSPQNALARPLTPIVVRRYYTFFILGGIAGAAVACLLALVLATLGYFAILGGIIALSLLVIPAAFALALWLLAKIVADASTGDIQITLPVLAQAMRARLHSDPGIELPKDDTDAFLKGMQAALTTLARDRKQSEFDSHLSDFSELLTRWIDVVPPNLLPPDRLRFSDATTRFAGPLEIDLYEVSSAAIQSEDPNIVVRFESALLNCSFICLRREQPLLAQRFLEHIVSLYANGAHQPKLADALEARLDGAIFRLFGRSRKDAEPDWIALRFTLALAHDGIRFGRTRGALNAVGRLVCEEPRLSQGWPFPLKRDQQSLRGYIAIILTGWSLHVMRSPSVTAPARATAEAVLRLLFQQIPKDPAVLLAIWELYRGHGGVGSDVDVLLGIDRWDPQEWALEYREGIPATYWLDMSWGHLGLRAALLGAEEPLTWNVDARFATPASPSLWDPKKEQDALQDPDLAMGLDIPAEVIPARVQAAVEIIERRAKAARQHYADSIRKVELSEARVAQFRAEAIEAFGKSLRWHAALADRGMGPIAPAAELPTVTQCAMHISRECLVDCEVCCVGVAGHLGEAGARACAMQLVHAVEAGSVASSATLERLGDIQDQLRAARSGMVTAGFEPNVVILPDGERFAAALFDKPIWQVEGHGKFNGVVLGIWEGLTVLRCPYSNSSSALMLDTTKLLTKLRDLGEPGAVTIGFAELDARSVSEPTAEAGTDAPSSPLDIRVHVALEAQPLIGIANIEAARRIDLVQSDGAYRLDQEHKLYHRPDCSEIGERQLTPQVWMPRDMKPCPKCHPERWDFEARW
jgi:hypothetical protein